MAFVPFTGTKRKGAQPVCAALKACAILFFFMLAGKAGAKRQRRAKVWLWRASAFTEQVFVERFTNYDHWCQRKNGRSCFYDLVDKKLAPVLSKGVAQVNITRTRKKSVNLDAVKCLRTFYSTGTTKYFIFKFRFSNRKHSNSENKILIRLAGKYKKC
jgi:hypothetical protein